MRCNCGKQAVTEMRSSHSAAPPLTRRHAARILQPWPDWTESRRDLPVTVGTIVGLLAAGHDADEVLTAYPYLERDDISQALACAASRSEEQAVAVRVEAPDRHEPVASADRAARRRGHRGPPRERYR